MSYLLLPLMGGIFWGLCYACLEQTLHNISIATWYIIAGTASLIVGFVVMPKLTGQGIDFTPLLRKEVFLVALVAVCAARLADMSIGLALANKTPATFVAFGEISYVLFLPLIAFLLFKDNQITPHMMGGGALVLVGITVLILGQANANNAKIAKADDGAAPVQAIVMETVKPAEG